MSARLLNLWVFRENRRRVSGREIKSSLLACLKSLCSTSSRDQMIAALLRAGELECAVADAGGAPVRDWMALTERLAEAVVSPRAELDLPSLRKLAEAAPVPQQVELSAPEGFAYYALDPLSYARVIDETCSRQPVAVVGIRSIGTTLSAVVTAEERRRGIKAERITVRPEGHPYNRQTNLSPAQLEFVRRHAERASRILVVDEGPGLSGSSFLSTAEALQAAGVSSRQITLVCGHQPCFSNLGAEDGPRRARHFQWKAVSHQHQLSGGRQIPIGGGEWRRHLFETEQQWPAQWISFERLKYLSGADGTERRLLKFLGLGHYGEPVLDREARVGDAGFGPVPSPEPSGFASYPWIAGNPAGGREASESMLERLAGYCAFRAREFRANQADGSDLQQMTEHNLAQLKIGLPLALTLERPVIADGRMQPHEWLQTTTGPMLKTDSGAHGDDHFCPGPTDIAWDLAGAIVEWNMASAQKRFFLARYSAASGEDAAARVGDYIVAYRVFRHAYCRMAANALEGSGEQRRLESAAEIYRAALLQQAQITGQPSPVHAGLNT
jgi:hypothetical protein